MWMVASARWSVGLRSLLLRLEFVVRSMAYEPSARPPEIRRSLPWLITRFARQIARFSARLLSGQVDALVSMGLVEVASLPQHADLIKLACVLLAVKIDAQPAHLPELKKRPRPLFQFSPRR